MSKKTGTQTIILQQVVFIYYSYALCIKYIIDIASRIIQFCLDKEYKLNFTILLLLYVTINQIQGLGAILVSQA